MNSRFQFTNQTSKVEKIIDYNNCEVTRQLALSNLCSRLKSLTLDFDIPSSNVISQLINMPVLKYLKLTNIMVKLMELELLHQNVPSIQSMFFKSVVLYTCEIPRDVKPAASVTKLGIDISTTQNRQAHIEFYLYLGKKYPLVDTFTHNSDLTIAGEGRDYARDVYNGGVLPFYQTIGPRIDTFEFVEYCDGLDAFKKFDDSGIKLKQLIITSYDTDTPFLGELAQSQQAKYLKKLMVNDMGIEDLEKLNRMEALESLEIDCHMSYGMTDDYTIDFSQLIEACPARLSILTTNYAPIICTEPTSNLTSITWLELGHLELTPTLAKCLETSFPKLSTLYLQVTVSTSVTISLSNHHLEEADISVEGRKSNNISTVTSCIDGIQYYVLKKSTRQYHGTLLFKYDGESSQPDETPSEDSTILTFKCASVKKIAFYAGNE